MPNSSKNDFNNVTKADFEFLIQTLKGTLDFERWGFTIIHAGVLHDFSYGLVCKSKQCIIKFWAFRDRPYTEPEVYVRYGRLHAQVKQSVIEWKGEMCHCWHDARHIVNYLDGIPPTELTSVFWAPRIYQDFSNMNKDKGWRQEEWLARFQAVLWQQYGQHLFDILDLKHQDLWEGYSGYLFKYYECQEKKYGPSMLADPPFYKIC